MNTTNQLSKLNITKHPIDRTALIAGIMFSFAGIAYLVDDHGLINVTEGAVAGTIVIVIGLVLLLAAVIDSPEAPVVAPDTNEGVDTAGFETPPEPFDSFDSFEAFDEAE